MENNYIFNLSLNDIIFNNWKTKEHLIQELIKIGFNFNSIIDMDNFISWWNNTGTPNDIIDLQLALKIGGLNFIVENIKTGEKELLFKWSGSFLLFCKQNNYKLSDQFFNYVNNNTDFFPLEKIKNMVYDIII